MLLVGLTGSIGMGKTETAKMFARLGVPVYDADAAVHALYARGGAAVAPIAEAFPEAVRDGAVDRARLGAAVVGKPEEMQRLEAIIHPLVRQAQIEWLQAREAEGAPLAVLDIPLLFETGGDALMDVVVVVSAPPDVQRERVLARPGMTGEKFEAILARQVPDAEKRARADYVVETHRGLDDAFDQVKAFVEELRQRAAKT
ncbi:MAG: dephospho-CoA kinase [bacterium]